MSRLSGKSMKSFYNCFINILSSLIMAHLLHHGHNIYLEHLTYKVRGQNYQAAISHFKNKITYVEAVNP